MKTPRTLSGRLRYARKLRNLDAITLDKAAGISRGLVSHLESGRRDNPTMETLQGLAGALGCSLDWLVSGVGDGPHPPAT